MKNTNIVLTVLLVATLLVSAIAGAVEISDIISTDPGVIGAASVATSISAVDATETEIEVESEIEFKTSTKNTVSKGQGWIVTESKGALAEILFVSKEGTTTDGAVTSISRGWLKAGNLKLKLESNSNTDVRKTFDVTGGDGSVKGTLTLTRGQAYQTGFAVWNGDLDITVGDKPFDAKINLAIEEKNNRKNSNSGNGRDGKVNPDSSGTLVLGSLNFNLEGRTNNINKLEFRVIGENNVFGELKLESRDSTNYVGKIKVEELGDADDRLSGKITATLKLDGDTLYGPIKFVSDDGSITDSGTIKIALIGRTASDDSKDEDKSSDDDSDSIENEDRSGSNSGSSDGGFWKRFWGGIFGSN